MPCGSRRRNPGSSPRPLPGWNTWSRSSSLRPIRSSCVPASRTHSTGSFPRSSRTRSSRSKASRARTTVSTPSSGISSGDRMDWTESFRKAWVVTGLTFRYLLGTRRVIATALLALFPIILTVSLAAARVERFNILLFQDVMIPVFLQVVLIFVAVLVRRPLAVGLLIGFVWESVVDSIPGDVPKLSVIHYLKTILKDVVAIGPLGGYSSDLSAGAAAGVLNAFSIAMVILSAFVFQQMEFRQKA